MAVSTGGFSSSAALEHYFMIPNIALHCLMFLTFILWKNIFFGRIRLEPIFPEVHRARARGLK